ncbi:MAG: GNAT family N-acetyltransferase [Dehalococcoidales bacterium]|jgi:GNAT superfamily N-acetyltransferase
MLRDFYTALNVVKIVLAVDLACTESDFDKEGVFIYQAKELPGRRKFPFREKTLIAATMGRSVIVSCCAERQRWARINLSGLARDDIYTAYIIGRMDSYVKRDGQCMAGPDLKYICTPDIFHPCAPVKEVKISLNEGETPADLYQGSRFTNALGFAPNPLRPRVVTAVARLNGEIAGVAAACADCDIMWQIGVDTLPEYRRRGIGKALVGAVTQHILDKGKLPYYSTSIANIASRGTAAALGYKPAWVELYAREMPPSVGA